MSSHAADSMFRAFGRRVASQIEIPGAQGLDAADAELEPELRIVLGETRVRQALREHGPYTVDADSLMFEQPDVARYACSKLGSLITVEALHGVTSAIVGEYLIATALPAALWMRGDLVLHAAAATLEGLSGAIAFAGASGSGKSTLLRALVDCGASVLAEDTLCIRGPEATDDPVFEASGLPASILLRRSDAALDADRETFPVPPAQQIVSATLAAVVVLECPSPHEAGLQRLSTASAFEALLHHRHRATAARLLGLEATLLPRFAALAQRVPVYLWNRPQPGEELTEKQIRLLRELPGAPL